MITVTCTHEGCEKKFTKNNTSVAEAALAMHVGRVHTHSILNSPRESGTVLRRGPGRPRKYPEQAPAHAHNGNGVMAKGKLSRNDREAVLIFIGEHHEEFKTKTECFRAALKAAGATGKIKENSVAVCRYFQMAMKRKAKATKTVVTVPEVAQPRLYRRDVVDKVLERYSDPSGSKLECPNCRYDFGPLKASRVPARFCPGCGTSMQAFISQLINLLNP